jgi:hypothetical protein
MMGVITLSDKVYNGLRALVEMLLPGLVALYVALSAVYSWGFTEQVAATGTAVAAFLGLVLRSSRRGYTPPTDGSLYIEQNANDDGQVFSSLEGIDLNTAMSKGKITLDIKPFGS